jgi:hypothetical protein
MVVDIYNGIYAVPGKCGSRYWSKTDLFNRWDIPTVPRAAFDSIYNGKIKIDYIIIRNPLSHLKAAIQTEIMDYFDDVDMIEFILKRFPILKLVVLIFIHYFVKGYIISTADLILN